MAGTTTNFGFQYPQDTDPLADGASEIQAFAENADATFADLKGGTTDQLLAKNSGTDMDFKWIAQPTIPKSLPIPESGRYMGVRNWAAYLQDTAIGVGVNLLNAMPIFIGEAFTADRISIEVQTGGSVGATIRLGIYENGTNNLPGNLLIDAGTVVSTSTGSKEITINQALPSGVVWLCSVGQGSATNNGNVNGLLFATAVGAWSPLKFDSSFANYNSRGSHFRRTTTVTGALPATFGSGNWQNSACTDIAIRRA